MAKFQILMPVNFKPASEQTPDTIFGADGEAHVVPPMDITHLGLVEVNVPVGEGELGFVKEYFRRNLKPCGVVKKMEIIKALYLANPGLNIKIPEEIFGDIHSVDDYPVRIIDTFEEKIQKEIEDLTK